jgi:hypothetical protein
MPACRPFEADLRASKRRASGQTRNGVIPLAQQAISDGQISGFLWRAVYPHI